MTQIETAIETAVADYKKALAHDLNLARQETVLSKKRIAARRCLNDAKDILLWLERDYKEDPNQK